MHRDHQSCPGLKPVPQTAPRPAHPRNWDHRLETPGSIAAHPQPAWPNRPEGAQLAAKWGRSPGGPKRCSPRAPHHTQRTAAGGQCGRAIVSNLGAVSPSGGARRTGPTRDPKDHRGHGRGPGIRPDPAPRGPGHIAQPTPPAGCTGPAGRGRGARPPPMVPSGADPVATPPESSSRGGPLLHASNGQARSTTPTCASARSSSRTSTSAVSRSSSGRS